MKKQVKLLTVTAFAFLTVSVVAFSSTNDKTNENKVDNTSIASVETTMENNFIAEGKCGEGKETEKKAGEKSEEKKCGEGKCGEGKASEQKTTKKKTTTTKEEKKCGEGKCGE